jgi:imidazolonepropionase-like amidohydrolase
LTLGACADLLVVDQDPLEKPDTLENLQQYLGHVMIDGKIVFERKN